MIRKLFCGAAAVGITLAAMPASAAELVTNGGFETGDFTGFTRTGNQGSTGVEGTFFGQAPYEGSYQGVFGAVGSTGTISQNLATVVGHSYKISFALFNFGGTPSSFSADFGGSNLLSLTNPAAFPYTFYTYSSVASSALTPISFTIQQNPSYFLLDDISVTDIASAGAAPEPAAWALMIVGFGAAGAQLRRRQTRVAFG